MNLSLFNIRETQQVIELFTTVFSDSEGESEGQLIGNLVSNLISDSPASDLIGCTASNSHGIVGCIFFSRFFVPGDHAAFILSPVAISSELQGTGIGQKLIRWGLQVLSSQQVELVFTYGDPNYYSQVGFRQIDEGTVSAPFRLSQPEGWLAQHLGGKTVPCIQGVPQCVSALSDQKYW